MALPISPPTRNRLLAVAVLAACAFCVAIPRPWQDSLRGAVQSAALSPQAPLAAAHDGLRRASARIRALWSPSEELERLRRENLALREALARQTDQITRIEIQLRGFAAFEAFRKAALNRPVRTVPANVIGADASPWRHSLVIDRGSADGLRVGTPAVWGSSIVGLVLAVRPHAATVRLLTDSNAGLTVRIARTGDVGLLRGTSERDGLLQLKWIHLHPIEENDWVVTSGLDPLIPAGLVAGQVTHASKSRKPLFYEARVRSLLDLGRLTDLLLLVHASSDVDGLLPEGDGAAK